MEENKTTDDKEIKKKEDFNIIVSYADDGQSFKAIVENIIIRKMSEIY